MVWTIAWSIIANVLLLYLSICVSIAIINEVELPRLRYFNDAPRLILTVLVLLTLVIFAGLRALTGFDGSVSFALSA